MIDTSDDRVMNYLKDYKAMSFPKSRGFPIKMKGYDDGDLNGEDKGNSANKYNPKAINMKLVELVRMMHGSFESKQKIIEDFNAKNPECSKKSIEKKMRDMFEKDKKGEDPRQRWYATESTLIELNLNDDEELKTMFSSRFQEVMDEINKQKEEV